MTRCVLIALLGASGMTLTSHALAQEVYSNDPYAKPDDSYISISGTVVDPQSDRFTLDYGDGLIDVEMDDWDIYGDNYPLLDGDDVTVYGRIDDDLFEVATIEAGSVYVDSLNTYLYASSADEEGRAEDFAAYSPHFWSMPTPLRLGEATVRGTISSVDTVEGTFNLDTGLQQVTVDTARLGYNPLDDVGFQQIDVGDRVSATGRFDRRFFEDRKFEATSVITLADASRNASE